MQRCNQEARGITGQKAVYKPSKNEWDEHQKTHIPFRKWCPHCVRGKCKGATHEKGEKSEEGKEQEVPVISLDHMGKKAEDEWPQRVEASPIIVGINRKDKGVFAHMAPREGVDAHAIKIIAREIKPAGYNKLILKSDQEPAIRELIEAVKRERSENIEVQCDESRAQEEWGSRDCNPIHSSADQDNEARIAIKLQVQDPNGPPYYGLANRARCVRQKCMQGRK